MTDKVLEESMRLTGVTPDVLRSAYPGQRDLLLSAWMFQLGLQPDEVAGPTGDRLLNCFLVYFNVSADDIRIFDTYDALCCCFYQYLDFVPPDIPPGTIDRILWMLRNTTVIPVQKPVRCRIAANGHLYFYADTDVTPNFGAEWQEPQQNLRISVDTPPISNLSKDGSDHLHYDYDA